MVFNDKEKEVFTKLEKITKESNEGEYNYKLLSGGVSNEEFDILIKYMENEIELVNSNPDSKKRFEITKSFFQKLENENLFHLFKKETTDSSFLDAKKVAGGKLHSENLRRFENQPDSEEKLDAICKFYVHSYERACRLHFKPLAKVIENKKINACGECLNKIIQYYPDMEFVLRPFIPQIRNSIDHLDYYYDPKKKLVVFEDREKPPIAISIEQLRIRSTLQVASEVSMAAADHSLNMPLHKTAQHYFKKTEEYCKILQIDFHKIVVAWVSRGSNILGLHNALEKLVKG